MKKVKTWSQGLMRNPGVPLNGTSGTQFNKNWVHPPDALIHGRVEYTVRFLGEVEVGQPKGTEVVKEAIQKIRFQYEVRRAQSYKVPRVELHVNVDGLTMIDQKTRMIMYKYPLHRISFCADDKQDKRVFSFIAKQADGEKHNCFVFLSEKLAEEITLTIGEAFDLAYRKFLEGNGQRDLEQKKTSMVLRKRIQDLEAENAALKFQLAEYQRANSQPASGAPAANGHNSNGTSLPPLPTQTPPARPPPFSTAAAAGILDPSPFGAASAAALGPPPTSGKRSRAVDLMTDLSASGPEVGRKLENLQLDRMEDLFDDSFNPRENEPKPAAVAVADNQLSNYEPTEADLQQAINALDCRLSEMREGFQRGLSFGEGDFQLQMGDTFDESSAAAAKSVK